MSTPPISYTKPWLSITDQVAKLEYRGLLIGSRSAAESFLGHINYYRFTGFCLAFQDANRKFNSGATFADVMAAHSFDAALRDHFTESLELVEIDLRTVCAHFLGQAYGPFGHTNPGNFHPRFNHAKWLDILNDEAGRSNELFVTHFRQRYQEFPNLPIWTATEIMSFGCLSRMIGGLKKNDRKSISNQYGLSPKVLSSVTHHLSHVRNLCAHHCRLWDRVWAIKPELPSNADWRSGNAVTNGRLFATLLLMRLMLSRNHSIQQEAVNWRERVMALLQNPPNVPDPIRTMGLTPNWESHPVWQ